MYGAIFDFAAVTVKVEFCIGAFNSPFASSVHWRLLFKRYVERIVFKQERERKQEKQMEDLM